MLRWLLLVPLLPSVAAQGDLFASPHTATCFLDIDGSAGRSAVEPVWLQVQGCGAGTQAGDVRLTTWEDRPGGTLVGGLDDDAGMPTAPLAAAYAYHDADGSAGYNVGDPLFAVFGPVPGPLRTGDIPLMGDGAFRGLQPTDARVGLPVAGAAVLVGGESYAERDGNPGFTTGDWVYLDLDASGRSSLGDLRLATQWQPGSTTTSTTAASTSATSHPSSSSNPSSGPGTSSSTSPPTDDTASVAPTSTTRPNDASSSGALLAALALIGAVWARSKH